MAQTLEHGGRAVKESCTFEATTTATGISTQRRGDAAVSKGPFATSRDFGGPAARDASRCIPGGSPKNNFGSSRDASSRHSSVAPPRLRASALRSSAVQQFLCGLRALGASALGRSFRTRGAPHPPRYTSALFHVPQFLFGREVVQRDPPQVIVRRPVVAERLHVR